MRELPKTAEFARKTQQFHADENPINPIVRCRCTGEHGRIIFHCADKTHVKVRWFNGKVTHEPVSMMEEVNTPNNEI